MDTAISPTALSLCHAYTSSENVLNERAHDPGRAALHITGDMGVGVQGKAGLCVAQDAGEGFGVHSSGQGVRGKGVTKLVEVKSEIRSQIQQKA